MRMCVYECAVGVCGGGVGLQCPVHHQLGDQLASTSGI